jgi:hypothetical protein
MDHCVGYASLSEKKANGFGAHLVELYKIWAFKWIQVEKDFNSASGNFYLLAQILVDK